jgi:predicted nuclease with TOPRIM domain
MQRNRSLRQHYAQQTKQKMVEAMTDNETLRDHLADVINERNELLRKVELLEARIDVLTEQLAALWKVDND